MMQGPAGMPVMIDEVGIRLNALQMAMALYTDKNGITNAKPQKVLKAANGFADFVFGPQKGNEPTPLKVVKQES